MSVPADPARRPAWIFGYGSLVWRPAFEHEERVAGVIRGWRRRFWQGSTDHRGVPGAPGRVVTLEEEAGARCHGVAYRLGDGRREEIHRALDVREQGGYRMVLENCSLADGRVVETVVYVATPDNPNYLGPADAAAIARQVLRSSGPSGDNDEYVLELDRALREMGAEDDHVAEIARAVRRRRVDGTVRPDGSAAG